MWEYNKNVQQPGWVDASGRSHFPIVLTNGADRTSFDIDGETKREVIAQKILTRLGNLNAVADVNATPVDLAEAVVTPDAEKLAEKAHEEALAVIAYLKKTAEAGVDVSADLAEAEKKVKETYADVKPFIEVKVATAVVVQ